MTKQYHDDIITHVKFTSAGRDPGDRRKWENDNHYLGVMGVLGKVKGSLETLDIQAPG